MNQNILCHNGGHRQKLFFLILLSLAISCICFSKTNIINKDGVSYIYCAQYISEGQLQESEEYRRMPFFPFLILCLNFVLGDWELSGVLISMISTTLLLIPFYLLALDLWGDPKAFISSLLLTFCPSMKFNSIAIFRDPIFLLFVACFLLFFLRIQDERYEKKRGKYHICAFFFAFLSSLTRLEGILLLIVYIILAARAGLKSSQKFIRKATAISFITLLVLCTVFLSVSYEKISRINQMNEILDLFRNPLEYQKQMKVYELYNQIKELEKQTPGSDYGGGALQITRNYLPVIYLISLVHIAGETVFPVMFLFVCLGLYACFSWKNASQRWLLFWLLFFLAIPYLFLFRANFLSHRYLLGATLILYFWSGCGCVYCWEKIQAQWKISYRWAYLLLFLILLIPAGKVFFHSMDRGQSIRDTSQWLKEEVLSGQGKFSSDTAIFSNDPRIFFYAGIRQKTGTKYATITEQDVQNLLERQSKDGKVCLLVWYGELNFIKTKPDYVFHEKKKAISIYRLTVSAVLK